MKICIVAMTGLYPLDVGGPANVVYFLARELNRNGIDVYMFIRANKEKFVKLKKSKEIKELGRTKLIPIDINYNIRTFLNIPFLFSKILEANKKFKEILNDIDVIIYNMPPTDVTLCFPLISRINKKKQIFVVHGGLFNESKNVIEKILIYIERNWFDKVVAVSSVSRDFLLGYHFNADRIEIIHNGIDLRLFEGLEPLDLEGEPKILFVGPLRPIKGADTLLRAFSVFVKEFLDAHLYIVGDGPEKHNLEKLSKDLGLTDKIHFEGWIAPGRDVYRYYGSCDLYVMSSHNETFGITLLEAMASKIPVIATDIEGGSRNLIKHGAKMFLFPPGDYETLAKEMVKMFKNEDLVEEFSAKNYLVVKEHYTWEKIGSTYISKFEELLCE